MDGAKDGEAALERALGVARQNSPIDARRRKFCDGGQPRRAVQVGMELHLGQPVAEPLRRGPLQGLLPPALEDSGSGGRDRKGEDSAEAGGREHMCVMCCWRAQINSKQNAQHKQRAYWITSIISFKTA